VAFAADSESREGLDIYVKSIGHGTRLRLTTHPSDEWSPAWSPDGQTIAFARLGGEAGFEIFLIPALGGAEQKIYELDLNPTINEVAGPLLAWDPDGKWLAVPCRTGTSGGSGLCLLSPHTRELRPLTAPGPGFMNGDTGPTFSPDGARLAFVRQHSMQGSNLYILDLDDALQPSGDPVALTSGHRFVASPAWTPVGSEIVFFAAEEGESSFALWRIRASGGSEARLVYPLAARSTLSISRGTSVRQPRIVYTHQRSDTNIWRVRLPAVGEDAAPVTTKFIASTQDDAQPQFSPEGDRIVFRSRRSGFSEVWLCDSDGSNVRPLTNLGALIAGYPRWHPDGRRIVFHARLRDQADLYVVDTDGGIPRRLTTDPTDEVAPNWSRDGRWVYFARPSQTGLQLWKMPAEDGEAVQLTSQGGNISFESSDGRTVYYSKSRQHPGLFHMPVADRLFEGPESRLLDSALPSEFFVAENRIYFIDGKGGWNSAYEGETLKYLDLASGQVFKLAPIDGAVATGLAVSADGRTLLYTRVDSVESDLMMLDGFQ
jgi:Tol biopolymer transport system component